MLYTEGTIAAISTPLGEGGIGIVRISGDKAFDIISDIFEPVSKKTPEEFKNRTLYLGEIKDPDTGESVDQVLVALFRAPYTYTREDMVEINCHGGVMPLQRVLQLVLNRGARIADPGEFTFRAFLNGRIDLTQAEAVMDIIRAKTQRALTMAKRQLSGASSQRIREMRDGLLSIIAHVEANIDFPEDDIPEADPEFILSELVQARQKVEALLKQSGGGRIVRDGLSTLILGNTNVGKSSLLNSLLEEERAIVTDIPGTTRDVLEEYLNIEGIPIRIIDTAGIRDTQDKVEKIGIDRAKEYLKEAELVLLVFDASRPLTQDDRSILALAKDKLTIGVLNKADLPSQVTVEDIRELLPGKKVVSVSALKGEGIEDLKKAIHELIVENLGLDEGTVMAGERQCQALEETLEILDRAIASLKHRRPIEVVEVDLRDAWEKLGEITGDSLGEDVVKAIFANFCIGK